MARTITGDDNLAGNPYVDVDGDEHQNASTRYVEAGVFDFGEGRITNWIVSGTVAVTIPTLAAETSDSVDVDVSAAFTASIAVGDVVLAAPLEALPTDCLFAQAYVIATDHILFTFDAKEGGGVTGAAKNFKIVVIKASTSP